MLHKEIRTRICQEDGIPSELREACNRLKPEELGHEYYFDGVTCKEIVGAIKSIYPNSYERKFFHTGDSDYDIIVPIGEDSQVHYRLRDVRLKGRLVGCLVTSHSEPSNPIWHGFCGAADSVLGDNKPEWCKVDYNPREERFIRSILYEVY